MILVCLEGLPYMAEPFLSVRWWLEHVIGTRTSGGGGGGGGQCRTEHAAIWNRHNLKSERDASK